MFTGFTSIYNYIPLAAALSTQANKGIILYMKKLFLFNRRSRAPRRKRSLINFGTKQGKLIKRCIFGAAIAVAVLLLALLLRPEPVLMNSAEIATVWDNGVLRVGLRNDVPGLAQNGEGIEWDIANALARRIISQSPDFTGDTLPLEVVEVTSMTVGAKLMDGTIDAAICLMPRGANSAYAYSRPYYKDPCRILVWGGREHDDLAKMKIGCIQSASSSSLYVPSGAARNKIFNYFEARKDDGYDTGNIVGYGAYTDLIKALDKGTVDAIVINDIMFDKYGEGYDFSRHSVDLGTIDYAVAVLSSNSAIATLADMLLDEMGY